MFEVKIQKLVHGGQGLGELQDGRKVFVWGALPGETVRVRLAKNKRSYAEGVAEEIIIASSERISPREPHFLSTSPWQIVSLASENTFKKQIVQELFTQAHVVLPDFNVSSAGNEWHYRNKMEYSFWGDDAGLHLAMFNRGTHRKLIVQGSVLAHLAIDRAANEVLVQLQQKNIRAGDLKTIIVRCNQDGEAVASLFVKPRVFEQLELPESLQGLRVYHSNPKSPASVPTQLLYELGDSKLQDTLLGKPFMYDSDSFFQVNLPVFELALQRIKSHILLAPNATLIDMYAGVGSIGLSVAPSKVELIELDPATAAMARANAENSGLQAAVTEVFAEKALAYISVDNPIIFDPPRAGLHPKVIEQILETPPPQIIYLSCNPATQARDLAILQEIYDISYFEVFNFFPHTPHIESLAILKRKSSHGL